MTLQRRYRLVVANPNRFRRRKRHICSNTPTDTSGLGIALYLTWVGGFLVTAVVLTRLLKGIKLI